MQFCRDLGGPAERAVPWAVPTSTKGSVFAPVSEARAVPGFPSSHSLIPRLSSTAELERVASSLPVSPSFCLSWPSTGVCPHCSIKTVATVTTPLPAQIACSVLSPILPSLLAVLDTTDHTLLSLRAAPLLALQILPGHSSDPWVLESTGGHSHSPICIHFEGDLFQVPAPTAVSSLRRVIYSYLVSLLGCLIRHLRLQHIQSKLSFPPSTNKRTQTKLAFPSV